MEQRYYNDTSVFGGYFDEEFAAHTIPLFHLENLKIMKTTEKKFDAVKYMRQQRETLSEKLSKMTKEEILDYFKKQKIQTNIKPSS